MQQIEFVQSWTHILSGGLFHLGKMDGCLNISDLLGGLSKEEKVHVVIL